MPDRLSETADEGIRGISLDPAETQPSISVAQILTGIDDKYGLLADGRFERKCIELLKLIDETRVAQGYIPYDDNQRIIAVCELYRVLEKFRDRKRKDGTSVFYEHLLGVARIMVTDIGLTGLASLIAAVNHDTLEDLIDPGEVDARVNAQFNAAVAAIRVKPGKEISEKKIGALRDGIRKRVLRILRRPFMDDLIDTSMYADRISGFDPNIAEEIAKSVREICLGVTKEKLPTVGETRDATLYNLLSMIMDNVKAVFIKFPDRAHNLRTLDGHVVDKDGQPLEGEALERGKETQRKIVDETELIYLPLAQRTGARKMVKFFVEQCMNFENPQLAADFSALSMARLANRIDPYEAAVRSEFSDNPLVRDVKFIPRGLEFYTSRSSKRFKDLDLSDLRIGRRDPMFDILVTTVPLPGAKQSPEDSMEMVSHHVQAYFGAGPETNVEITKPKEGDLSGIKVHIFNPRFGGHLNIRINDYFHENRLDRGILIDFHEQPPQDLRELIGPVLDFRDAPELGSGAVDRSRRELLRGEITVFDVHEVPRRFSAGATALDFANSIHQEILEGAQAAYVEDRGDPEGTLATEVSLIDPLEDGKVYFIRSCMTTGRKDRSLVRMHPSLLFFCQAPARKRVRQFLKDPFVPAIAELTEYDRGFIRDLNLKRTRRVAVGTDKNGDIISKINSRRKNFSESALTDHQIVEILRQQDEAIDVSGAEYLRSLCQLFGVPDGLIRDWLVHSLSLPQIRRGKSGKPIRRDQMKRHFRINRAVATGEPKANPLFVLADYFERIAAAKRPSTPKVKDRLWEVQITVPDRAGELADFAKEFSRQVGVNLYNFRSRKRPVRHEDVMIFRIDLDSQGIPIYEFFIKLLKLSVKYPTTRLTGNPWCARQDSNL